jgi:hypothetical protein
MPCRWLVPRVALAMFVVVLLQGGTLPSAALAASCAPRPPVGVTVTPTGPQQADLAVTVTAGTSAGAPSNQLDAVRFNAISNGWIEAGGQTGDRGSWEVTLPADTTQFHFVLHADAPSTPPTAHLVVHDACGAWPTFVGTGTGRSSQGDEPVSCLPRPPVEVSTTATSSGMQSTLRATGAANHLLGVEFGAATNSLIDIADHAQAPGNFTVSVPSSAAVTFSLHPLGSTAYSVPLVVVDRCGRWPTLVGAGAPASLGGGDNDPPAAAATPELDSFVLFALGALGLGFVAWRRRQPAA